MAESVGLSHPAGLSDDGLTGEVRRAERESRRWDARRAALIAEAERRGLARRQGYASTTAWLMAMSGDPAAVCRSRVAVAEALQEMPETRTAFASGEVSESRVRLLSQAQALAPEQFAKDEAALVAQAATVPSIRLPQVLEAWKCSTDPAGAEAQAERRHALRALHVSPAWSGMVHVNGDLDPEGGLIVLTALRSLSEPAALDPADPRTPAQRQADALVAICHRHLDGTNTNGGQRPQVTVTVGWDTLQQGSGVVDTEAGPISAQTVRRLACDATVSWIILDADSIPVQASTSRRVVSRALRRALNLRDQHCTHPGCDLPARYCDAHHITHWADGGKTEPSNLRLLCRTHHRTAHHDQPYPIRR